MHVLVKDIDPGHGSGDPRSSTPYALTAAGKIVYFSAVDGAHGRELRKSNGTAAGTAMVKNIWPGWPSSRPLELVYIPG